VISPETKMAKTGLPLYVVRDKQRDGNPRWLFRRKGLPKVTLPGPPHSKEFWTAYAAALNGQPSRKPPRGTTLAEKLKKSQGTLEWLCAEYYGSGEFKQRDLTTQKGKRWVLAKVLDELLVPGKSLTFRSCPVKSLTRKHIVTLRDRKVDMPNAANNRLRYLKQMFVWAIDNGYMSENPADKVKRLTTPKGGHHTWTLEEVRRYEARHPIGTKARLALALTLFTGVRISDLRGLGKQHLTVHVEDGIKQNWFEKPQHKNRNNDAKWIRVPILPVLQDVIDASPIGDLTYLVSERGAPFSASRMGTAIKGWCREAGLPHCSAHGLRKAGATIAAENGASAFQLMSIFGWEDAQQAVGYTRKMERQKVAAEAMHLLVPKERA
jgi:integrase